MGLDCEVLQTMLGLAAHLGGEMGHVLREIVPAACRPAGDGQVARRTPPGRPTDFSKSTAWAVEDDVTNRDEALARSASALRFTARRRSTAASSESISRSTP